jgi:acetyl-CoA synthetase
MGTMEIESALVSCTALVAEAAVVGRPDETTGETRSGKIMRRLLRSLAAGEAITQDISTLENPAILDQLAETN